MNIVRSFLSVDSSRSEFSLLSLTVVERSFKLKFPNLNICYDFPHDFLFQTRTKHFNSSTLCFLSWYAKIQDISKLSRRLERLTALVAAVSKNERTVSDGVTIGKIIRLRS